MCLKRKGGKRTWHRSNLIEFVHFFFFVSIQLNERRGRRTPLGEWEESERNSPTIEFPPLCQIEDTCFNFPHARHTKEWFCFSSPYRPWKRKKNNGVSSFFLFLLPIRIIFPIAPLLLSLFLSCCVVFLSSLPGLAQWRCARHMYKKITNFFRNLLFFHLAPTLS